MKIAFGLGHPAHFHLYKNVIRILQQKYDIEIYISDKDILKKLLVANNLNYYTIAISKSNENIFRKLLKLITSTFKLYNRIKIDPPDLFVGCLSQLSWISRIMGKKNIFNAEDDITYTYLQGIITYPFVSTILCSHVVKTWPFNFKKIGYAGYHKLAYLHPNRFLPKEEILKKYIQTSNYYLVRIVNQNAYHDVNAKGLDLKTLKTIICRLEKTGKVYISSEKELPLEFQNYILNIDENDIHHILYYADLFIGDSQSMTVEAAMLGTPSIRINNFANKISVIKELEYSYQLTYSVSPTNKRSVIPLIDKILAIDRNDFRIRRDRMIKEKIDVTNFLKWFIINYPESRNIMKSNPKYQYNFS